jgi:hypothetical protein
LALGLLVGGQARAQHYLGVRGGYGGGLARFDAKANYEMRLWQGGPSAGISWKYYSSTPIVGAVQADLQFVTKGFERVLVFVDPDNGVKTDLSSYTRRLTAIELPLFWHTHFYVAQRRMRIFLNLGVYGSYYLSAYEKGKDRVITGNAEVDGPYTMIPARDNRFDYGLVGGLGASYMFKRYEVFVEGRYNFGYSDLMKAMGKYPGANFARTPVDMINISAGIYYRLGKRGILAPRPRDARIGEPWGPIPPRSLGTAK